MIEWDKYPNFSKWEFDCSQTGHNKMQPEFIDILQTIRSIYDTPMIVNSGYRDRTHPEEARKKEPGVHFYGLAADISVRGEDALDLIDVAYGQGIRRIGVGQNDNHHFIHIDIGDKFMNFPPNLWSY